MSAELNHLLTLLPESNIRHATAYDFAAAYPQQIHGLPAEYSLLQHDLGKTPAAGTTETQASPTTGRLAGEPAFCGGRHCCQWSVGGHACNNHYPSAADLDKHVATEHAGRLLNGQPSGDYHCYWAGCSKSESFGNKPKLTRHIHSHTGHKPHPCLFPGCGKGFVTKEQLKNHETTHTKTKEHICPECGKGFAVKTALTSHMNVHRGAKPYICEECGKGFADSSNLSKHKAIHKRISLKRHHHHHHHHHHKHSRSSTISTQNSTPLFSHGPYPAPPAFDDFPALPAPSVEVFEQPWPQRGRPCYDEHCSDHQVPCTDQDCPTGAVQECDADCDGPDCDPWHEPDCEPCTLPYCDLPDCLDDCVHFCDLPHYKCFDPSHEDSRTPPPPGLEAPLPRLSETTTPEQTFVSADNHGTMASSSALPTNLTGMDEAGYKQLHDFIHGGAQHAGSFPQTHSHHYDASQYAPS